MSKTEHPKTAQHRLELKVGAFVVLTILVGMTVVVLLGRSRHVFAQHATLHAAFADVQGLRAGAPVWLSGVNVGTVSAIAFGQPGDKTVRVNLEIMVKMLERIHTDSVARIDSQGLLGDKIVSVSMGGPLSPSVKPDGDLATQAPADFNQIITQAGAVVDRARVIADNLADVSKELGDPKTISNFRDAIASIKSLLAQTERGPGLAHSLFYDRSTADSLRTLVAHVDQVADHVDEGVRHIDGILAATDGEGRQVLNNLSRAARNVGETAGAVQRSKMISNLEKASGDLVELADYVKSGRGTVGALIVDPAVYEQLVTVLGGIGRSRVLRALVRFAITRSDGHEVARTIP